MKSINIDNTPLSEKIAETIRGYIMKGLLKPGDRLVEPKLSEMLGISRTPIREAFRLLEVEGFITLIPRRGAVVTQVTDKDVDDIFVLKIKLESLAARLAAAHITQEELDKMKALNEKMRSSADAKHMSTLVNVNSEFHDTFLRACKNERLVKFLESLQMQFKRATVYSFSVGGRIAKVVEEHDEIIKALESRDADLAEKIVEEHNMQGWTFIKSRVRLD